MCAERDIRSDSSLPRLDPPVRLSWRTSLTSGAFIWAAPQVNGQRVAVRCGNVVACLDVESGALQWTSTIQAEDVESKCLLAGPGLLLTVSVEAPKPFVVALKWETGEQAWQSSLPGEVPDDAVAVTDEHVWLVTAERLNSIYSLRQLDLRSGTLMRTVLGPRAANHPVPVGDRVFFTSNEVFGKESGLYVLNPAADAAQRIAVFARADRPRATGPVIAVMAKRSELDGYGVVCLSTETLRETWSATPVQYAVAADALQIAYLRSEGETGERPVLCDIATGEPIWTAELPIAGALGLFFSEDAVCVLERRGMTFLDRSHGKERGRIEGMESKFSWGGGLAPGRLILGHRNEVLCFVSESGASPQ